VKTTTRTKDNFENGVFWELYNDLERQLQNFLEYVPYLPGNEQVRSFKLLNLILSIGGHVDSAFKEMARYPKLSKKKCQEILKILKESEANKQKGKAPKTVPISLSLKAFGKEYRLDKEKVLLKCLHGRRMITPFQPFNLKTKAPKWWNVYNSLKHDVGLNLEEANLENTTLALAGAFLLNVRHISGALRLFDFGILKTWDEEKFFGIPANEVFLKDQLEDIIGKNSPCFVETSIFLYNYGRG